MRYLTALDFRQALETRLAQQAHASGAPFAWLRKQVAFDRLLARLLRDFPDAWMLKGALALDYRLRDQARTSKDMDLACSRGQDEATEQLVTAAAADLADFFSFHVDRTTRLDELVGGSAIRYHLTCRLGRSVFDEATIDVGFTDSLEEPDILQTRRCWCSPALSRCASRPCHYRCTWRRRSMRTRTATAAAVARAAGPRTSPTS